MDLIFCQGIKMSRLCQKTSKFLLKPKSFIYKHPEVTVYRQLQYLDKQKISSPSSNDFKKLDSCFNRLLEPSNIVCKINFIYYGTSQKSGTCENKDCYTPPSAAKPTVFQRMKQMTKDYWHILIPVHLVTSAGWMGIFYVAAKNGVDIVGMLESLNLSERYLDMLRGSTAHWAVAYALYKIMTPLRYTVTLGGTTMSIRLLNRWGYIKVKGKNDPKLEQSLKCAEEHKSAFKQTSTSTNQSQSDKT